MKIEVRAYKPNGTYIGLIKDDEIFGGINYDFDINPDDDLQIGAASAASAVFTLWDNNHNLAIGDKVSISAKSVGETGWESVGTFWIKEITRVNNHYKFTCYDHMVKFDIVVDNWLDGLSYPITISDMLTGLCTYCGVELSTATFTNSSMSVVNNFTSVNISGRQVLQWIAEVAATNFYVDRVTEKLCFQYPTTVLAPMTNSTYSSVEISEYSIKQIDKLWVGATEGDVGVVSGTGDNVYRITNNPLLYANSSSEIQANVDAIYAKLNTLTGNELHKVSISLFGYDAWSNPNNIYQVKKNGSIYKYIFNWLKIDQNGISLGSKGKEERNVAEEFVSTETKQLRGSINILKRDLEETKSTIIKMGGNRTFKQTTPPDIMPTENTMMFYAGPSTETYTANTWYIYKSGKWQLYTGSKTYRGATYPNMPVPGDITLENDIFYRNNGTIWEALSTKKQSTIAGLEVGDIWIVSADTYVYQDYSPVLDKTQTVEHFVDSQGYWMCGNNEITYRTDLTKFHTPTYTWADHWKWVTRGGSASGYEVYAFMYQDRGSGRTALCWPVTGVNISAKYSSTTALATGWQGGNNELAYDRKFVKKYNKDEVYYIGEDGYELITDYWSGRVDMIKNNDIFSNTDNTLFEIMDYTWKPLSSYRNYVIMYEVVDGEAKKGDLWYNTGATTAEYTNGKWYRYNGITWEETSDTSLIAEMTEIKQTSNSISAIVQGLATFTKSYIEPTTKKTGDIWQNTTNNKYYQWQGLSWVEITEDAAKSMIVINKMEQTLDGVLYQGPSGTTIINGSNITTGTIEAERLHLSGAITWDDFTSETQEKVGTNSRIFRQATAPTAPQNGDLWYYTGATTTQYENNTWYSYDATQAKWVLNESELPSYIKSTYIDSTTVKSPTIVGGTIKAAENDDNYTQMSANGLGIYTKSGGYPNVRVGYETSQKTTPFITLGQGVDAAGTNAGMVKKFTNGIWIGDNDNQFSSIPGGTGFFIDISNNMLYKYINGIATEIGYGVFG